MSVFEIVSLIFIWVVVGVWICYKNNWFKEYHWLKSSGESHYSVCPFAIIFCPFLLLAEFFRVFIIKRWT